MHRRPKACSKKGSGSFIRLPLNSLGYMPSGVGSGGARATKLVNSFFLDLARAIASWILRTAHKKLPVAAIGPFDHAAAARWDAKAP